MKKLFLASIAGGRPQRGWLSVGGRHAGQSQAGASSGVYSWSGCYGGGFVGYGWGKSQHRSADPRVRLQVAGWHRQYFSLIPYELRLSNPSSGRHHAVLRHERRSGRLQRRLPIPIRLVAHWHRGATGPRPIKMAKISIFSGGWAALPSTRVFVSQTTERWMATARLRLGWAADKWLFFITGGGAWSGVEVTVWDPSIPLSTAHHKRTLTGWTVGAGWEYALGYGWSWKSEFLYIDYGWTKLLRSGGYLFAQLSRLPQSTRCQSQELCFPHRLEL